MSRLVSKLLSWWGGVILKRDLNKKEKDEGVQQKYLDYIVEAMTARKAAMIAGDMQYNTGKPCGHGHHSPRYTTNGGCVVCVSNRAKEHYKNNPGASLASQRRIRGIPEPTRPDPGRCENCGDVPKTGTSLNIDHDHDSGKFRGWLCRNCNMAIGGLGDNMHGLERALAYLRRAQKEAYLSRGEDE